VRLLRRDLAGCDLPLPALDALKIVVGEMRQILRRAVPVYLRLPAASTASMLGARTLSLVPANILWLKLTAETAYPLSL
jgi:hypothetical protein